MTSRERTGAAPAARTGDALNDWALRVEDASLTTAPGARRTLTLVGCIAGIAFVVLYAISYSLLQRTPLGNAPDAEIIDYYGEAGNLTLTLAGMVMMPFAGIAFLYFMVTLRAAAGATGIRFSRVLAHVQQAVGIAFVVLLFVGTAALIATPASIQFADAQTDPVVARMLPTFGIAVLLMFGMRMASMFVLTTSSIGRATGLIPSWFAWSGYAVGLLLLFTATLATWFALLFPAWVLVLCVMLLWRRAHADHPAGSDRLDPTP
jgi:hypothetical protein